ncbi:hypothetical protein LINGRAHAP2_LOCUS23334, partial [Linum grandiflorum]
KPLSLPTLVPCSSPILFVWPPLLISPSIHRLHWRPFLNTHRLAYSKSYGQHRSLFLKIKPSFLSLLLIPHLSILRNPVDRAYSRGRLVSHLVILHGKQLDRRNCFFDMRTKRVYVKVSC